MASDLNLINIQFWYKIQSQARCANHCRMKFQHNSVHLAPVSMRDAFVSSLIRYYVAIDFNFRQAELSLEREQTIVCVPLDLEVACK